MSLLNTKTSTDATSFFPSQAAVRGGIGLVVATGSARGSITRLPEAQKAQRAWQAADSRPGSMGSSLRSSLQPPPPPESVEAAAVAAASVIVGAGAGLPKEARKEWERGVPHPRNFVSAGRRTLITDVPVASKWAGISFFENDPAEVKRHLDIMQMMDNAHYEVRGCIA